MKKYIYILLAGLMLSSCNEWFDVTSSSEIRKKEHFKTVKGFQQSLVGDYIGMASDNLYGKNLTWNAIELLAHQYKISSEETLKAIYQHNYKDKNVISITDNIWAKAYNIIVNINDALASLEEQKSTINPINYAVLRGEFLAQRAYLNFDLMRLYSAGGWATRGAEVGQQLAPPYVTKLSKHIESQITIQQAYDLIVKDLEEAKSLLKDNDPITKVKEQKDYALINADGFYNHRDLHLNYYAVCGLLARVHQWRGTKEDLEKAYQSAKEVVELGDKGLYGYFDTTIAFVSTWRLRPYAYAMVMESLFSLEVPELDSKTSQYIFPDFNNYNPLPLQIQKERITELYGTNTRDIRLSKLLYKNTKTDSYMSLRLYQADLNASNRNKVNLITLPEVYYIAADAILQTTGDLAEASKILNRVRKARGLAKLKADITAEELAKEIKLEYEKEFIAQGVMFFYYKRNNQAKITGMEDAQTMTDKEYVLPYPDFEIQSGRRQTLK